MPRVPLIGRLFLHEYLALLASFVLLGLEGFIRVVTLALPGPVITLFYRSSRGLFNYLSSPQGRRSRNKKKAIVTSIAQASDFVELCELFGYYAEEHIVQTGDGYLLGLHRLGWRQGEEGERVNSGEGSIQKKVVYLHHGLMMNSEAWVCLTEKERCLPFLLVEKGYDVWLGNNRGNKYSKKSVRCPPTETRFWEFSIDQFAFHDIPDVLDYILSTAGQPSLSYIGFSQGTAQAFATLSIHPTLNDKVDVFIALAPAMSPSGLTSGIVNSFVKASPEVLFLAFGRRSMLSSATMWQALLYPPIFVRLIDTSLSFLFGWHARNITPHQKLAAYPHLYSFTSTKSVVHWFQIIRTGTFQMYDDEVQAPFSLTNSGKYYKVAKFPTRNIKTPIVLVYGGSDSLVDIEVMRHELPKHTQAKEIPHYEHLDFLWAADVHERVFPHVFEALDSNAAPTSPARKRTSSSRSRTARSTSSSHAPPFSEDEAPVSARSSLRKISQNVVRAAGRRVSISSPDASVHRAGAGRAGVDNAGFAHALVSARPATPSPRASRLPVPAARLASPPATAVGSAVGLGERSLTPTTQRTNGTARSRPEGWWSSDEVGGSGEEAEEGEREGSPEYEKSFEREGFPEQQRLLDQQQMRRGGEKRASFGAQSGGSGSVGGGEGEPRADESKSSIGVARVLGRIVRSNTLEGEKVRRKKGVGFGV